MVSKKVSHIKYFSDQQYEQLDDIDTDTENLEDEV